MVVFGQSSGDYQVFVFGRSFVYQVFIGVSFGVVGWLLVGFCLVVSWLVGGWSVLSQFSLHCSAVIRLMEGGLVVVR